MFTIIDDKKRNVYNIIKSEYYNYIISNSINRSDLSNNCNCLIKIIELVNIQYNSQYSAYYKIVADIIISPDINSLLDSAKYGDPFSKLIYFFSILKILLDDYLKDNEDKRNDINIIVNNIYIYLNNEQFINELLKNETYIKYTEISEIIKIPDKLISKNNKHKTNCYFWIILFIIGGIVSS